MLTRILILISAISFINVASANEADSNDGESFAKYRKEVANCRFQATEFAQCINSSCRGEEYIPLAFKKQHIGDQCRSACRKDSNCRIVSKNGNCGAEVFFLRYAANASSYDGQGASYFVPASLEKACSLEVDSFFEKGTDDDPFGDDPFKDDPFDDDPFDDDPFDDDPFKD